MLNIICSNGFACAVAVLHVTLAAVVSELALLKPSAALVHSFRERREEILWHVCFWHPILLQCSGLMLVVPAEVMCRLSEPCTGSLKALLLTCCSFPRQGNPLRKITAAVMRWRGSATPLPPTPPPERKR